MYVKRAGFLVIATLMLSPLTCAGGEKDETLTNLKAMSTIKAYKGLAQTGGVSVHLSPDGDLAASAAQQKIRLWEVKTGKLLRETEIQYEYEGKLVSGFVGCLGFVDEGRLLAGYAVGTGKIHLLDVKTLKSQATIRTTSRHGFALEVVATESNVLVTVESVERRLSIWDSSTRQLQGDKQTAEDFSIRYAALSADGRVLVLGTDTPKTDLRVIDIVTRKEIARLGNEESGKRSIDASVGLNPNGRYLLAGVFGTATVRLWDVQRGGEPRLLCWDGRKGKPPFTGIERVDRTLDRTVSTAQTVGFSPNGKTAIAMCTDGEMRLWEVATGKLWGEPKVLGRSFSFSRDGSVLATGRAHEGEGEIQFWDWRNSFRDRTTPLTDEEAHKMWQALLSDDPKVARRAMANLSGDSKQAVTQLKQLTRVEPIEPKELAQLIKDLDHARFTERQRASRQLAELRGAAELALRESLTKDPSRELKNRIEALLFQLTTCTDEELRVMRGVEVLESIATTEAKRILDRLAGGAPGVLATEEAKSALRRIEAGRASTK